MDYRKIIFDLRDERTRLDRAIEAMLELAPDQREIPDNEHTEEPVQAEVCESVRTDSDFSALPKPLYPKPEPKPIPEEEPLIDRCQSQSSAISIPDAVLKSLESGPVHRNEIELVDRVQSLRPGTPRPSIQAAISELLRSRKIHKGPDLKIRLVLDGRVQGLPALQ